MEVEYKKRRRALRSQRSREGSWTGLTRRKKPAVWERKRHTTEWTRTGVGLYSVYMAGVYTCNTTWLRPAEAGRGQGPALALIFAALP